MQAKLHHLTIIFLCLISFCGNAQEITCDAFCITDVRMDTSAPNLMYVTLFFSDGINDFINYPWIAEVIDAQGDTVGVGVWNFFGQFGNTSNEYPVTVTFDSIPEDFNATMVFHYDTSVCLLSFPCTMTGIEYPINEQQVSIYPNPFSSETNVYSEKYLHDLTIKIFNLRGQLVKQIKHQSGNVISLQQDDLIEGIYFIQLTEGNRVIGMRKVIIE